MKIEKAALPENLSSPINAYVWSTEEGMLSQKISMHFEKVFKSKWREGGVSIC